MRLFERLIESPIKVQDDAEEPVAGLRRLYQKHATIYLPNVHIRLGDEALASGARGKADREFSRAIRLFQDAMERNPEDARIKNALAWFYVRHRVNLDEAFRLSEEARRLDRSSWEVIDTLAEIHFVRGMLVKARDHSVMALQMSPGNSYLESQVERFQLAVLEEERR